MMADIRTTDNTRTCDVVTAGVHITARRLARGMKFSSPTYNGAPLPA